MQILDGAEHRFVPARDSRDVGRSDPACFSPCEDPEPKPLIRFRNVTKKFGEFTAIDCLDLDIREREFFALLGPSGCGKTTLMRMVAGFEEPSAGVIELSGEDIGRVPPNKRPVNMMFQSYALFPHLNVWDNIAFGLRRDRMEQDAVAARVAEMLELTRLERFAHRKPHQISGGQRQRVALARSLAKAPKLLLLDEPLGALDRKLREATQFELMDIQESTGTTFLIVTHDQEEAMTVADRIAVMDEGRIVQVDTPDRLYENPKSRYVADFVGDVNIIEATAMPVGDGRFSLAWEEGEDMLTAVSDMCIENGQRCFLVVRPEKIAISAERPDEAENTVRGNVDDIGYLGDVSIYHVRLESGRVIKAQAANQRRISRRAFTWEDPVWLSWTATAGVLLAH